MAFARVHTPVLLLLLCMGLLPALAASFTTPAAGGPARRALHPSKPGSSSPLFGPRAAAGVTGAWYHGNEATTIKPTAAAARMGVFV